MHFKTLLILLSIITLQGCTRALVAKYEPGVELAQNNIEGKKIAVHEFLDNRAWIDSKDEKSKSFIAKQGVWKFGIEFEGVKYQPVSLVLQDIFIQEFKSNGVDAIKGNADIEAPFHLKGNIINFEFENETGFVTVTSRRHVALSLTLTDENGKAILNNQLFNEVNRENEGMGVMHSTNVEKLMSLVLKKVVTSVVERTNEILAKSDMQAVSVTLNGKNIPMTDFESGLAQLTSDKK